MQTFIIVLSLSFNCMLDAFHHASGVWISRSKKTYCCRPANKNKLRKLLKAIIRQNNGKLETRYMAIALLESGARIGTRSGDSGRACGVFQIHARYSYPLMHLRKNSDLIDWRRRTFPNQRLLTRKECTNLRNYNYSVKVMKRLFQLMDKRNKHPCHHNSGIYSSVCDYWYKQRINIWTLYFEYKKYQCSRK